METSWRKQGPWGYHLKGNSTRGLLEILEAAQSYSLKNLLGVHSIDILKDEDGGMVILTAEPGRKVHLLHIVYRELKITW